MKITHIMSRSKVVTLRHRSGRKKITKICDYNTDEGAGMKQWKRALAAATVFLTTVISVDARSSEEGPSTGNDLLEWCSAVEAKMDKSGGVSYFDAGRCMGMLEGVNVTFQTVSFAFTKDAWVCFPQGYTNGQGVRVVTKYLKDHPKELHQPAAVLVMNSMKDAFPCP